MVLRFGIVGLLLSVLAHVGCDRSTEPAPLPPATAARVNVEILTTIPPGRATHVTSDQAGQIVWSQESESGAPERIFSMTDGALPIATTMGTAAILKEMGQPAGQGTIQSICFDGEGNIYFYFTGGQKRHLLAALGCFVPRTGQVKIIADRAEIMKISGMGQSLALARGTLVRSGSLLWLWLRHSDDFVVLSLDLERIGATLRKPFEHLYVDGKPVRLTVATEDVSSAGAGALLWLDRATGRLWKISPQGDVSAAADLAEVSRNCTMPVVDDRGRMVLLATQGSKFSEPAGADAVAAVPAAGAAEYPALIVIGRDKREVIRGSEWRVPGTLKIADLTPTTVVSDRTSLVVYNSTTGELVRVRE